MEEESIEDKSQYFFGPCHHTAAFIQILWTLIGKWRQTDRVLIGDVHRGTFNFLNRTAQMLPNINCNFQMNEYLILGLQKNPYLSPVVACWQVSLAWQPAGFIKCLVEMLLQGGIFEILLFQLVCWDFENCSLGFKIKDQRNKNISIIANLATKQVFEDVIVTGVIIIFLFVLLWV